MSVSTGVKKCPIIELMENLTMEKGFDSCCSCKFNSDLAVKIISKMQKKLETCLGGAKGREIESRQGILG
jgi:hypothetical protein